MPVIGTSSRVQRIALAAVLLCLAGCGGGLLDKAVSGLVDQLGPDQRFEVRRTSLGEVQFAIMVPGATVVNSQNNSYACVINLKGKYSVALNGQKENVFDSILQNRAVFSPDGTRLAYAAMQGQLWAVMVDHLPGPKYEEIANVVFSPDSRRIAYAARQDGLWVINVDDHEGPAFGSIGTPVFSPDSKHVAYSSVSDAGAQLLVDHRVIAQAEGFRRGQIVFSPDGRRVAFAARSGEQWAVAVDSTKGRLYDDVNNIGFDPNGSAVAYIAKTNDEDVLVIGEKEIARHDHIFKYGFLPASDQIVYAATDGDTALVLLGDSVIGKWTTSLPPDFVLDSSHVHTTFLGAREKSRISVVVDGREGNAYDSVGTIVHSPSGDRYAFVAQKKASIFVVVDGHEQGPYEDQYLFLSPPSFSTDGKYVAYGVLIKGKSSIFVNGIPGEHISAYLPSGRPAVTWDSPKTFHYLAAFDNNINLVEEEFRKP